MRMRVKRAERNGEDITDMMLEIKRLTADYGRPLGRPRPMGAYLANNQVFSTE